MSLPLLIYLVLSLVSIVIILRLEIILNTFLDNNTAITNEIVLEEFKSTVRECMCLTLAYYIITIAVVCTCAVLIWDIGLFKSCISYMLFRLIVITLGDKKAFKLETKARKLKCANSNLEEQYKQICFTWAVKPLADF